ncbi:MAG TPA: hypothetical protein VGI28_15070 [Stellaceae bacterium]|jgi:hypothetical protein
MITVSDGPATASSRWRDFCHELNRWGAEGRIATLWWRDDDAVTPCRQLDELFRVADGIPVALAVIPAFTGSALAGWLEQCAPSSARVLQHGWRHLDHGGSGKKSEFPSSRRQDRAVADLRKGHERVVGLFGSRALEVLAPPWNRFEEAFLPILIEAGIASISTIKPRSTAYPLAGLYASNVHVDLIAWRGERGFIGAAAALDGLTAHLRDRRCGSADTDEPTGILTHHLVQDSAAKAFLGELIGLTRRHPAVHWLDAGEVFLPAGAAVTKGCRA